MFIKSKICFSVFVLYEITAITLLYFQRTCDAMFGTGFCDTRFKYFAGVIAVPLLAYLIWMWVREIIRARRRHHFIARAKHLIGDFASAVHEKLGNVSGQDIERILTMAILLGVKKYSDRHPNLRRIVGELIGMQQGESMEYGYDMDTENVVASQGKATVRHKKAVKSTAGSVKKKK